MFKEAINEIRRAMVLLVLLTFLAGLIYPTTITVLAQLLFPWKANGSIIEQQGKKLGSALIGQTFTEAKYFWSRPSATTPFPYNAENSSGSNMGPSNLDFLKQIKERADLLRQSNIPLIPIDLVTASGSGLDPDISPLSAYYQVQRIAKSRNIAEKDIQALIEKSIKKPILGILGEYTVNVLELNIALDKIGALDKLGSLDNPGKQP